MFKRLWLLLCFSLLFCASRPASAAAAALAAPPAMAAAGQVAPAASAVVNVAKDIFAIPVAVGEILLLPMGVVETVFCPLPGLEFMSGVKHIGTGLIAPFKLVTAVLTLPYNVVNHASGAVPTVTK